MSSKGKGKVAGPVPVKILEGIPVGEHRDRLVSTIATHVTHCDNFSPCISWPEHKKANRVNELWNTLKDPWGLPECKETKKWFNDTVRNRWSDFKNRKLKSFFDSAYPDLAKAIANCPLRLKRKSYINIMIKLTITAGSDESTANTQIVLNVFGRKRLGIDSSGPSKQR